MQTSQIADAPAPHSVPTNLFVSPRLSQQNSNVNNRTSTIEISRQKQPYNGTPRLAGTVVQNLPRSSNSNSPEGTVKKSGAAEKSTEAQTSPGQAGPVMAQPQLAAIDSATIASTTPTPSQPTDVTTSNDINFLRAVGVLVVLVLGTWGAIKFFSYWRSLAPFSSSAGGGIYSDDSQEGPSRLAESGPKPGWFESEKKYHRRVYPEDKDRIAEDATVGGPKPGLVGENEKDSNVITREAIAEKTIDSEPKQVFFDRDAQYRDRVGNGTEGLIIEGLNGSAPAPRLFERDEQSRDGDRTLHEANGNGVRDSNGSAPIQRFVESNEASKKDIQASGQG